MTPVLAVSEDFAHLLSDGAGARGVPVQVVRVGPRGQLLDEVDHIDAVQAGGQVNPGVLRRLLQEHGSIRWIAVTSAGVDAWLLPEATTRQVAMTRARHIHDVPVAEFAMGLMLAAAKRLPETVVAQQRKEWLNFQPLFLAGKTLVIVGYGEIGQALAQRARGFDMRVVGVRQRPAPDPLTDLVVGSDRLEEVLREADYVVLLVPGGPKSRGLLGEAQLRCLPARAYLINVGRGELIDEAALDRALREKWFAGALLDTFAQEPPSPDNPLWTNPRVVMTPHLAGLRAAPLGFGVIDQLVDNIARFGRGEPLLNQVDFARGY